MKTFFRVVSVSADAVGVDREQGIIKGAAIMQLGPISSVDARPYEVDETTLKQLVHLGTQSRQGVKARWTHPEQSDGMGTHLGRYVNFRLDGNTVRADLQLAKSAMQRDYGKYVLDFAEEDPGLFGNSPAALLDLAAMQQTQKNGRQKIRLKALHAVDVVDSPATTANGFFSTHDTPEPTMPETQSGITSTQLNQLKQEITAEFSTKLAELTTLIQGFPKQVEAAQQAEQKRLADVNAVFAAAKMSDQAAVFFSTKPGGTVHDAREVVLNQLLKAGGVATSTPAGSRDLPGQADANAAFKAEYQKDQAYFHASGISEEEYVNSRRVDQGLDLLQTPAKQPEAK